MSRDTAGIRDHGCPPALFVVAAPGARRRRPARHAAAASTRGRHLADGSAVAGLHRRSRVPLDDRTHGEHAGPADRHSRAALAHRLSRRHGRRGRHDADAPGLHVPQQPRPQPDDAPAALRTNQRVSDGRLFTLSQGQLEIDFPPGFGMPIWSDEDLNLTAQVLNLNPGGDAVRCATRSRSSSCATPI